MDTERPLQCMLTVDILLFLNACTHLSGRLVCLCTVSPFCTSAHQSSVFLLWRISAFRYKSCSTLQISISEQCNQHWHCRWNVCLLLWMYSLSFFALSIMNLGCFYCCLPLDPFLRPLRSIPKAHYLHIFYWNAPLNGRPSYLSRAFCVMEC